MEKYEGTVKIAFDDIPSIQLKSVKPENEAGFFERLSIASQKRRFTLRDSWQVEISGIDYLDELNGTLEIPHKNKLGEKIIFDGASIPLPWLVSLLTMGILRPLGVMLIGSIIHDYAYTNGHLRVAKNRTSNFQEVALPRHKADKLLRDIIGTVNKMPRIGYIGWFFVRIGWLWVRYNGKRFGGKKPLAEFALLILALGSIAVLLSEHGFESVLSAFMALYIVVYVLGLINMKVNKRKNT